MLMLSRMATSSRAARRAATKCGMTSPEKAKVYGPTSDGEKLCHIVPEDDPDTALCGKDVTGWPWNPPWPYCLVCLDLAGYELRE